MFTEFKKLWKNQCRKNNKPQKKKAVLKNSSERNFLQQIKVGKNNKFFRSPENTDKTNTVRAGKNPETLSRWGLLSSLQKACLIV